MFHTLTAIRALFVILWAVALAGGCAGPSDAPGYGISGRVLDPSGQGVSGVTVTLESASQPLSTTTDPQGAYAFADVASGTYALRASKPGYTLMPEVVTAIVSDADSTGNDFVCEIVGATYPVTGKTAREDGTGISGANIVADGAAAPVATTDSEGNFSFSAPTGSHTLTASANGFSFAPATLEITVQHAPVAGADFVGTPVFAVSGKVTTSAGVAIPGVTISVAGEAVALTDAAGAYTFTVPASTYTLAPSLTNYEFTPATLEVIVSGAAMTGQNFTGRDVVTITDCVVSAWSTWSACAGPCGGYPGTQTRTRTINVQPENGGASCPALQETQACTTGGCPVNCQVSAWSSWSACSSLCNGGQYRTRSITVAPANGGTACPSLSESQACNVYAACGRVRFVLFRCPDAVTGARAVYNGQTLGTFSAGPFTSTAKYYSPYYTVPANVTFSLQAWFTYAIGAPVLAYNNPSYRAYPYPACSGTTCVIDSDIALCSRP